MVKRLIDALSWYAARPWYVRLFLVLPWIVLTVIILFAVVLRLVPGAKTTRPAWAPPARQPRDTEPPSTQAVRLLEDEIKDSEERVKNLEEASNAALRPTRRMREQIAAASLEELSDIINERDRK